MLVRREANGADESQWLPPRTVDDARSPRWIALNESNGALERGAGSLHDGVSDFSARHAARKPCRQREACVIESASDKIITSCSAPLLAGYPSPAAV